VLSRKQLNIRFLRRHYYGSLVVHVGHEIQGVQFADNRGLPLRRRIIQIDSVIRCLKIEGKRVNCEQVLKLPPRTVSRTQNGNTQHPYHASSAHVPASTNGPNCHSLVRRFVVRGPFVRDDANRCVLGNIVARSPLFFRAHDASLPVGDAQSYYELSVLNNRYWYLLVPCFICHPTDRLPGPSNPAKSACAG